MDELFNEQAKNIKLYVGVESIDDPYEKNVNTTLLQPLQVKGIVTDLSNSQIQWKMPGIITDKSKEIIIEKIHKGLLEMTQKITVEGDSSIYDGWRINGKLQYRVEQDYLRAYIYVKKDS